MKRAIAILLLVTVVITGVFAATDVDLALNLKNNFFKFGFNVHDDKSEFVSPQIGLDLDSTFIFDKHNGFYLDLGFNMEKSNAFTIGSGYAYTNPLSNTMDMVITVGPHFIIMQNSMVIGFDFATDFKLDMTQKMFFRFGAGIKADVATVKKGNNSGYLETEIAIPRVAIGWEF